MKPMQRSATSLLTTVGFLCALTAVFGVAQVQRVNASSACCGLPGCNIIEPGWRCIGPEECTPPADSRSNRRFLECCWGVC